MVSDKLRRALIRPLMKRRPDLAYHRQFVFFRDLRHYMRGVVLESGSFGSGLTLHSFVFPLFDAARYHYYRSTHVEDRSEEAFEKYYPTGKGGVDLESEQMALEISNVIEQEALPPVADIVTPQALARRPGYAKWLVDEILGACFDGDYDRAAKVVDAYMEQSKDTYALPSRVKRHKLNVLYKTEYEVFSIDLVTEEHKFHDRAPWRMAYLGKLLRTDRSRIPALLHDWEAFTVNSFKLHKYWTPTPFPCER